MDKLPRKVKKCPVCRSSALNYNSWGEIKCSKCGYLNSSKEKAKIIEF